MNAGDTVQVKSFRPTGFAALSVEKRRAIASMGGIAAHARGTAHQFSTAEAIAAGRKRGKLAKQTQATDYSI